jgi:hypothetical protein
VLRNYPARDPEWDPNFWWRHDPLRSRTLVEIAKLGAELVRPAVTVSRGAAQTPRAWRARIV